MNGTYAVVCLMEFTTILWSIGWICFQFVRTINIYDTWCLKRRCTCQLCNLLFSCLCESRTSWNLSETNTAVLEQTVSRTCVFARHKEFI